MHQRCRFVAVALCMLPMLGAIPTQPCAKYDLVINLKTAKALGVAVPSSLIARADEVIE